MANATSKSKATLGGGAAEWIIPVAAVALVFVYRSFYMMRIPAQKGLKFEK